MKVTPLLMRRPVNEPRGVDIGEGAVLSAVYFAPLMSIGFTVLQTILSPVNPGWSVLWLVFSLVVALGVGVLIAIIWGIPTAVLVARVLRRVLDWRIHLAAYTVLGAITGFITWLVIVHAIGGTGFPDLLPPDQLPGVLAIGAITAVSTAAGWASIWCASRAEPELDNRIDEDSRAEDVLVEEALE